MKHYLIIIYLLWLFFLGFFAGKGIFDTIRYGYFSPSLLKRFCLQIESTLYTDKSGEYCKIEGGIYTNAN